MADIGEMTPKRLKIEQKRAQIVKMQLVLKKDQLEIRLLECEEQMEALTGQIVGIQKQIEELD